MALSSFVIDYLLSLGHVNNRGDVGSLLEFGQSVTSEVDVTTYLDRIVQATGLSKDGLSAQLATCREDSPEMVPYSEARAIYRWIFGCQTYRAIDFSAVDARDRLDLNHPFELETKFDVVVNNGTSEHIFNQANVFEMMHRHVKVEGIMVHYTPGLGWLDHGFYNIQPMFFFDLAKYNSYEVVSCALVNDNGIFPLAPGCYAPQSLANDPLLADALICACLRRWSPDPFRFPIQHPYQ
jgi:SAM-dependent methyltransferase